MPHLIADIKAAERPAGPIDKISSQTSEEEIERWIARGNEPEHTFGYYCGLESANFPPTGQLTAKEMKLVCKAFEHLLFPWNSGIDLPKSLPIPLCYPLCIYKKNRKKGCSFANNVVYLVGNQSAK